MNLDVHVTERHAPLTGGQVEQLNSAFESAEPQAVLTWALERFHPRIALSSSFGAEDVVLIDMLHRINPEARVVTLDTLRLHTETYDLIDRVRSRYGVNVEAFYPDLNAVDAFVRERGYNCFYASVENRQACCGIRKVEPLGRALAGLDAWITGLRRDQASTRADVQPVEIDDVHGKIVKLNPLASWTNGQVWAYIREHDVPYNTLHDVGYPSIGCEPCTRAVAPGEEPRAGRWWWELDPDAKECGIHVAYDAEGKPRIVRGGL
jgi:phosphoadenosine phosphosulfate reductase